STLAPRTPTPASMLSAKNKMMRTRMPPISPTRLMSHGPLGFKHHARHRKAHADERPEEHQVAQVHDSLADALEAAQEAEGGHRVQDIGRGPATQQVQHRRIPRQQQRETRD